MGVILWSLWLVLFLYSWDGLLLYVSIETNRLTNRGGHLSPLQDHVLGDSAVSVDINALIFITQQHFHAISLRKHHDGMRGHTALNLREGEIERRKDY